MLYSQRNNEINGSDMMQHQSVIYHTNSILECQLLSLGTVLLLEHSIPERPENIKNLRDGLRGTNPTELIIWFLLGEHIFAYIAGIYRNYEISRYGQPDVNGIKRAPKESLL